MLQWKTNIVIGISKYFITWNELSFAQSLSMILHNVFHYNAQAVKCCNLEHKRCEFEWQEKPKSIDSIFENQVQPLHDSIIWDLHAIIHFCQLIQPLLQTLLFLDICIVDTNLLTSVIFVQEKMSYSKEELHRTQITILLFLVFQFCTFLGTPI